MVTHFLLQQRGTNSFLSPNGGASKCRWATIKQTLKLGGGKANCLVSTSSIRKHLFNEGDAYCFWPGLQTLLGHGKLALSSCEVPLCASINGFEWSNLLLKIDDPMLEQPSLGFLNFSALLVVFAPLLEWHWRTHNEPRPTLSSLYLGHDEVLWRRRLMIVLILTEASRPHDLDGYFVLILPILVSPAKWRQDHLCFFFFSRLFPSQIESGRDLETHVFP